MNIFTVSVRALIKAEKVNKSVAEAFVLLLSPITPHIMEELWQRMGHTESLAYAKWPTFDETALQEDDVEVVVQIMGKKRATVKVPVGASQDDVLNIVKAEPRAQDFIAGKDIVKVIYVPNRLINIVVK